MSKQQVYKIMENITTAVVTCVGIAFGLSSCNVTRTITTTSSSVQRGDTTVIIQSKTIEQYDASRKMM